MAKYEYKGIVVEKLDQSTEKFSKCLVVFEEKSGEYTNHKVFALSGKKYTELNETFEKGDAVELEFAVGGRKWNDTYFQSVDILSVTVTAKGGVKTSPSNSKDATIIAAIKAANSEDELAKIYKDNGKPAHLAEAFAKRKAELADDDLPF